MREERRKTSRNKNDLSIYLRHIYIKGRDPLTMGYLDNLDNRSQNKKKLQNRKKKILVDMFYL
jgi:hypothetical protein